MGFMENYLYWEYERMLSNLNSSYDFKKMFENNIYYPFFKNASPLIPFTCKVPISFDEFHLKIDSIDCQDERLNPPSNIREFHRPHLNDKGIILNDGSFDIHL